MTPYCGACLLAHDVIVDLDAAGVCPACGMDYGPALPALEDDDDAALDAASEDEDA